MQRDLHYTIDEKQKAVLITDDGYEAAEDVLQVPQRPAARPSTVEPLPMAMAMLRASQTCTALIHLHGMTPFAKGVLVGP